AMPECVCDAEYRNHHHYVGWIYTYFSDCVYEAQDTAAFYIGMTSLFFWILCQAPQFYKNWRAGTAEALSVLFLLEWLGGDSLNLAGCILTNQLPTQTYTAILFVAMDAIMMSQYVYLTYINPKPKTGKGAKKHRESTEDTALLEGSSGDAKPSRGDFAALEDADAVGRGATDSHRQRSSSAVGHSPKRRSAETKSTPTPVPSGSLEVEGSFSRHMQGHTSSAVRAGGSGRSLSPAATLGIAGLSLVAAVMLLAPVPALVRNGGPIHSAVDMAGGHGTWRRLTSAGQDHGLVAVDGAGDGAHLSTLPQPPSSLRGLVAANASAWEPLLSPSQRRLDLDPCKSNVTLPKAAKTTGIVMGYLSSILYLNSRLPQIVKNCQRRSVAGLSWLMFFCAFMGNVTTVTAIFMRISSKADWVAEAPFLPGNAGTLVFDFTIMIQYLYYTRRKRARQAARRAWKEALGSTAEEVMGSESLDSDSDDSHGAAPAKEDAVALLLAETPQLPPDARRGVHDIVEDVDGKYLHAPLPTPPLPPKGDAAAVRAAAEGWLAAHQKG
ncbi:laat-1, partial [Symbiodinium sp. KB8]